MTDHSNFALMQCEINKQRDKIRELEKKIEMVRIILANSGHLVYESMDIQGKQAVQYLKTIGREVGYEKYPQMKPEQPSITCPSCKRTSYHPEDVKNKFCPACGYHDQLKPNPV